jgi:hypothetical protein
MQGIPQIITAVIGLFLIAAIGAFIFSIIRNWGKIFIIFWGLVILLCSHLLLICLVVFAGTTRLPPLLIEYTRGILGLLEKLDSF